MATIDLQQTFFGENAINSPEYMGEGGFTTLLSSILPTVYIVASFLLFIYILVAGFLIISGGGDEKKTDTGKQALTNAIIGFAIIFTSYWLIQIIEVITGIPIL